MTAQILQFRPRQPITSSAERSEQVLLELPEPRPAISFEETVRRNAEMKERLTKARFEANKKVLRSYRIK